MELRVGNEIAMVYLKEDCNHRKEIVNILVEEYMINKTQMPEIILAYFRSLSFNFRISLIQVFTIFIFEIQKGSKYIYNSNILILYLKGTF